jgi:hypothetical protein
MPDDRSGEAAVTGRLADPVADTLARELERVAGEPPWAILLFGSRLAGTAPGAYSAYDLILIVDAYGPFYERLHRSGKHGRSPRVLTALAHILPPNIIAFDPELPGGEIAKVMVLTPEDFQRALSEGAKDHFLRGRLVQRVAVLRARDDRVLSAIEGALASARGDVLRWAGPWLPERFTAAELVQRLLDVSYAGEVRPESAGRVAAVVEAQRRWLEPSYLRVLEEAEREGLVGKVEGPAADRTLWRLANPPGALDRLRWRLYFLRSKIRATSRWLKHVVTFDDWLTYVQRKVERRTGMQVEVTPMERRLPLLLLWPKVFRVISELRRAKRASARSRGA